MKRIHTSIVKGSTLADLDKAIRDTILAARGAREAWGGMSSTAVENCDGWGLHSLELMEETLSDGVKALRVRVLFVGDV